MFKWNTKNIQTQGQMRSFSVQFRLGADHQGQHWNQWCLGLGPRHELRTFSFLKPWDSARFHIFFTYMWFAKPYQHDTCNMIDHDHSMGWEYPQATPKKPTAHSRHCLGYCLGRPHISIGEIRSICAFAASLRRATWQKEVARRTSSWLVG